jgi:tetratricopeptide (TPR) repeat protein
MKRSAGYAEKVIAINPKDVNALLNLATSIPDEPQERELNKVIEYGKRILDLPQPKEASDGQWKSIRDAIQLQNQQLVALMIFKKNDYVACVKSFEDVLKLSPRDTSAYYHMGICLYFQVRGANESAIAANKAHIAFIDECNKAVKCQTEENKAKIDELKAKDDALTRTFVELREKAMEAFARAIAIGGAGREIQASRVELEKLYRTKVKVDADKPVDGLDDYIAQVKKQVGD